MNELNTELAVIGCALKNIELIPELVTLVSHKDFEDKLNKLLFWVIEQLYTNNKTIDKLIVFQNAKTLADKHRMPLEKAYIDTCINSVADVANFKDYAEMVKKASALRNIVNAADEVKNDPKQAVENSISKLSGSIEQYYNIEASKTPHVESKVIVGEIAESLLVLKKDRENGIVHGVQTGFKALDRFMGGFERDALIVVGARPSVGKSCFIFQMANNMSKLGYNVAFFSLEMSNKQLITRLIGLESELPYSKLKNMNLDARETELFFLGVDKISRSNIIMNDNTLLTPNTLRSEVKKISRQKKLDAVFVDYVQLMGHDKSTGTREREIAEISRTMKLIAKENNVVVITAAQLNRSVENREDKKPKLSDLRESGALEQDADVVIFLHREDYYDYDKRNEPQVTDIIVAKARNGATGYCQLMFVPEKIKFYEIVAEGLDD